MKEIPVFFQNHTYHLFGVLYHPAEPVKDEAFVFVDAFAEEKLWSQRVMVSFARQLARRGYAVLRFDFMGHGDSDGNSEESTVETNLADILCARKYLRDQLPHVARVGLLGLRYGALLAMFLAAERESAWSSLILWDPLVDGEKYVREILRSNLVTQTAVYKQITATREDLIERMRNGGTVNVDGYQIGYQFYQQLSAIKLQDLAAGYDGPGLIVQLSARAAKTRKEYAAIAETGGRFTLLLAEEEPFWKEIKTYYPAAENVSDVTINWLEGRA